MPNGGQSPEVRQEQKEEKHSSIGEMAFRTVIGRLAAIDKQFPDDKTMSGDMDREKGELSARKDDLLKMADESGVLDDIKDDIKSMWDMLGEGDLKARDVLEAKRHAGEMTEIEDPDDECCGLRQYYYERELERLDRIRRKRVAGEVEAEREQKERESAKMGQLELEIEELKQQLLKERAVNEENLEEYEKKLVALREAHEAQRDEFAEKLALMSEEAKSAYYGMYGLGGLRHPEVDESLSQPEQLKTLEKEYWAIIDAEADKMERRKPLPYENLRTLWLIDFVEGVAEREESGEITEEQLEELTERLLEHLDTRETIWNRICWHERSLGFMKIITSEDGPQPTAEQLAMFEALPEIRAAMEVINAHAETFKFGDNYPLPDKRGHFSTRYAEMQMHSGTKREFYERMVRELQQRLGSRDIKINRRQATRILGKTEDYLKTMGWISMLDPDMIWNVNDELRDGFFGLTRNIDRATKGKPAGAIYGAGLFMARDYPKKVEEGICKKLGKIEPIIRIPEDRIGDGELSGSFYHVTTVRGKISKDGKYFVLFRPKDLDIDGRVCETCEEEEYLIPIKEVKIGGRPLEEGVKEIQKWEEKESREKKEPLNLVLNVRLIDLMNGGKKSLDSKVWDYIEGSAFGGALLFWHQCLNQEAGVYSFLLNLKWEFSNIDSALNLVPIGHKLNYLMNTGPFFNVLDSKGVVRVNEEGEIRFGGETGGMTKNEVRDMFRARMVATIASVLSPLAVEYKYISSKTKRIGEQNLDVQDIAHIEEVCFNEVRVADKVVATPFIKDGKAQEDLKGRLADLVSKSVWRSAKRKIEARRK